MRTGLVCTGITMELRLPGHGGMRWARGCLLLLMLCGAVFSTQCQLDPPGVGNCFHANLSVASANALNLQLPPPLPTTVDLCKWNSTLRTWDHAYSFVNETVHRLLNFFPGRVSLSRGDFVVQNVSRGFGGDYRFQDLDGKCLASLSLTVQDPVHPVDPVELVTWPWYLLLIPVVLVAGVVAWKLKDDGWRGWLGTPRKTEKEEATKVPSAFPNQSLGGAQEAPPISLSIQMPKASPEGSPP